MKLFTLTEEHVKLLRRMWVDWDSCETGAPCIDPKRPYGNSDVPRDVAEIIGMVGEMVDVDYPDDPPALSDEQENRCRRLHEETEHALQIVLASGSFEPGLYEADDYDVNWTRVPG